MNFRADRARELTAAFVDADVRTASTRARGRDWRASSCLTEYDATLPAPVAFAPRRLHDTLGELLAAHGLTQLRIAETEKYAHVTFFFSGGREAPYPGRGTHPGAEPEGRDLRPAAGDELSRSHRRSWSRRSAAQRFDVDRLQHRQPGHGRPHRRPATRRSSAAEAVDAALGAIADAVRAAGGEMLITADHGNLEMMRDPATGQPHTAHTVGPVPLVYVGARGGACATAARCAMSRRRCSTCWGCRSRRR